MSGTLHCKMTHKRSVIKHLSRRRCATRKRHEHDSSFSSGVLNLLAALDNFFGQNFHGIDFVRVNHFHQKHFSEGALANDLHRNMRGKVGQCVRSQTGKGVTAKTRLVSQFGGPVVGRGGVITTHFQQFKIIDVDSRSLARVRLGGHDGMCVNLQKV